MRVAWNVPRHLALIALAGVTSAGPLSAASGGTPSGASAGGAAKGSVNGAGGPRHITLDFVEAEISDVAKALSVQSGVNIVVSPSAKGKVTMRLIGTTLDVALRFISQVAGFDFVRSGDTYVIGTTAELRAFAAHSGVSDTWTPQHLTAAAAKELVQAALPYLTVQVQEQTNQVVLLGTAGDVDAARKFLAQADVPGVGPRVVQTLTPRYAKPGALASLLQQSVPELGVQVHDRSLILTGTQAQYQLAVNLAKDVDVEGPGNRVVTIYRLQYLDAESAAKSLSDSITTTVSNAGTPAALAAGAAAPAAETSEKRRQLFETLEVRVAPEVSSPIAATFTPLSIETKATFSGSGGSGGAAAGAGGASGNKGPSKSHALILTGTSEAVAAAGDLLKSIDVAPPQVQIEARLVEISPDKASNLGLLYEFPPSGIQELRTPRGTTASPENGSSGINFGRFIRTPFDINITLSALAHDNVAKLLANPRISVVDGEDANIFIGDLLRYRVLSSVTSSGELFSVETVPVGIALLVRPRVHGDGNITLKVHPVVSTVTSFIGPEQIPQTASREADSTIRMKDGETIVIGGLMREEEIKNMSKIPGLGDLPLIGRLFSNKNTSKKKTDVTVFLTAHILK